MTAKKLALQVVRLAGAVVVSVVLIAFLAVQMQQRTLRWRGERLLADMHRIRLYQSTWADAQRLMHRWGAWGYYDGNCTAASCKYEIEMVNLPRYNPMLHAIFGWNGSSFMTGSNLYEWFGGRGSAVHASFTVHDGTIWRTGSWIGVNVPRRKLKRVTHPDTILVDDDFEWSLSVGAESRQRLHQTLQDPFPNLGSDESLAGHPYYKVWRPSGCMILCQIVSVYYSTHTPPAEIERLTSFDFSCFTRFHHCSRIVDLLPAAEEWHLYDNPYESSPTQMTPLPMPVSGPSMAKPRLPIPCNNTPVWAQARDARYVLAVEALSTTIVTSQDNHRNYRKVTKVRVVSSLKELAPWLTGATVNIDNLEWFDRPLLSSEADHLVPGRRYIVFAIGNDSRDRLLTKDSPLSFDRCGLRKTPLKYAASLKGFAQNDTLMP